MADEKLKQVHVKSNRPDSRVVLWEVHPQHPGGEVYLAGNLDDAGQPAHRHKKVALTDAVRRKIFEGELVETTATGKAKKPPAED